MKTAKVKIGSLVTWREDTGAEFTRRIIKKADFNAKMDAAIRSAGESPQGRFKQAVYNEFMSDTAPIALAIAGKTIGDMVGVELRDTTKKLEILRVE